jgi:hypothetical protein
VKTRPNALQNLDDGGASGEQLRYYSLAPNLSKERTPCSYHSSRLTQKDCWSLIISLNTALKHSN